MGYEGISPKKSKIAMQTDSDGRLVSVVCCRRQLLLDGRKERTMNISKDDFGLLCICAIRYCHGRKTYMPYLVLDIVKSHFEDICDADIGVMYHDCNSMTASDFGDPFIDKPNWNAWKDAVRKELERRNPSDWFTERGDNHDTID